jgi:glycosyltransferase involved in cell wall biosynthesis
VTSGSDYLAPPPLAPLRARPAPPSFTVIIAAYQAATTISEAIESVFAQTLPAGQVLVCDDGSTDGLEAAVRGFGDRIELLRQEHRGVAAARNLGLSAASSEFVVLLDADDTFLPERLAALAGLAISRPDLDLLCSDAYFESNGHVVGRFYDENEFAVRDQRTAILSSCFVGWPAVRREQLLRIGGFDESPAVAAAEDWDAWLRVILAGGSAGLVPRPLLRYRIHGGSLSADRLRSLRARLTMLDKAAESGRLRGEERRVLEHIRRQTRIRIRAVEAITGLQEGRPGARRAALRAAVGLGVGRSTRMALVRSAINPGAAAHAFRRQFEDGGAATAHRRRR